MKKIKWGIMGTGRIARRFCDTLKELEQAEIYAVGSRTPEKSQAFRKEYGIGKAYGSYEEFVQDEQIDIVYVATPIGSHYENVKLCLNAGKNVLCEKAFTQSAVEAQELWELAKSKNLFLMEAMWTKCQPVFQKIMEITQDGVLGQIQGVEAKFYTNATREHRLIKDRNHGGALYDLTIYPLMYACALLGYEPEKVNAMAVIDGDNVDVMESIQLQYRDGSFASLTGGLSCEKQVSLYIHGSKARILYEQEYFYMAQKMTVIDWNNEILEEFEAPFAVNGYEYEAIEAMNCVAQGKTESALVPMEETIQLIRLMEACEKQWLA